MGLLVAAAAIAAANCGFPTSGLPGNGGAGGSASTTATGTTGTTSTTTGTSSTGTTGTGGAGCKEGATQACYTGMPASTEGHGTCKGGTQTCADGMFGPCEGQVTPQPEDCASGMDMGCVGTTTTCTGAPVWAEAFGAADSDFINAVAIDSQGNVIVTGGFSDTVNFAAPGAMAVTATASNDQNNDIFVAKYTSAGTLVWVQAYGGPGEDEGTGVAVDVNDDIVVVGFFQTSANFAGSNVMVTDQNAFVLKLAGSGSTIWAHNYGDATPMSGDLHKAYAVAVGQGGAMDAGGAGGNIAVVGTFSNSISFGSGATAMLTGAVGDPDGFVLELDGSGTFQWSQLVHGDPGQVDALRGVAFDGPGNVVVTGVGTGNMMSFGTGLAMVAPMPGGGNNHVLIGKYNMGGMPQWGLALGNDNPPGGSSMPRHMGNGIAADANGNIVVTGAIGAAIQFPTGTATMGPMLVPGGVTGIFVAKLDPAGNVTNSNGTWSMSFGGMGTDTDTGNAVALDQFGNVVIAGSFQTKLDIGTPVPALTTKGMTADAFAAKLDPNGKPLWSQDFAANMNSAASAQGVALLQEPTYAPGASAGDPYVGGQFGMMKNDTIGFGSLTPLTSMGSSDMFLAHLAP